MIANIGKCPGCGGDVPADAPSGLCPGCLLRLGFGWPASGSVADSCAVTPDPFSSTDVQVLPASRAFGDYELLEQIGHGGMGVVYKAKQRSLNRPVALKLLPLGPHASVESVKRFRAEALSTAALQHPNIVAIHEIGFSDGQHFIAMDYVEGQPLSELIRGTPLLPRRAARYVKSIAEAIHYAHERGILHRDLKPANVLVDTNDQPRVTDFGLAKRLDVVAPGGRDDELTVTGQVLGSPSYMPPEQASGARGTLDRRTDIYALGAMLYNALTGRPPYVGDGLANIVQQVLHTDPVAPRLLNGAVPRDLETICLKCLEKDPAKRYPTSQALAEELNRFLEERPIIARPLGRPGRAWRWCRRNPRLAGAIGVALLSLALGYAGVWNERQRAELEELVARKNAYAADMKEVYWTLEENDLGRALEALNRYRPPGSSGPDLRDWEWRYLWGRSQGDPHTLFCRAERTVSALAFSGDGKWLALRRSDGVVSLWDTATRTPIVELPGRASRGYKALAFSPRGALAYGSTGATGSAVVRLWDSHARKEIASLQHGSETVVSVCFSPDASRLASLDFGGMVRVWDLSSSRTVLSFRTERRDASSEFWASSKAASSATVQTNERPAPRQLRARYGTSTIWADHYGTVLFSPDGRTLAVGEAAPRVRLRDQITGEETILDMPAPADGITSLAFSPDSKLLAAGCGAADNDIHLWELSTGARMRLEGHKAWISDLAFSPDGRQLVSVSADQTIRLWNPGHAREQKRFRSNAGEIWSVAWSPDGRSFAAGGKDGSVRLWDPITEVSAPGYSVLPALCHFWEPAFLPDSQSFLTALWSDGSVVRWHSGTLLPIETLRWLGTNHSCLAFSSGSRWLALGGFDGRVEVWDYHARQRVTSLAISNASVFAVFFSARDRFLACGAFSKDGSLAGQVWEADSWREQSLQGIDLGSCAEAIFSPDERSLVVGYHNRGAVWWDLQTNARRRMFENPGGNSFAVAFSANGARFAVASTEGSIYLWDGPAGPAKPLFRAYGNVINDLIFSPDGRRLVAIGTSPKGLLKLWDLETGREVAALPTSPEWFCHAGFSPDGNTLFATSTEGSVLFWRAPSLAEIEAKGYGK